jgi:hypothetical protein
MPWATMKLYGAVAQGRERSDEMAGVNEEALRQAQSIAADETMSPQEKIVRLELLARAHEMAAVISTAIGEAGAQLSAEARSMGLDAEPEVARLLTAFAADLAQFQQWSSSADGVSVDAVRVLRRLGFALDWLPLSPNRSDC